MRLKIKPPVMGWRRWFAWYPVRAATYVRPKKYEDRSEDAFHEKCWVWLERVERRKRGEEFQYRVSGSDWY